MLTYCNIITYFYQSNTFINIDFSLDYNTVLALITIIYTEIKKEIELLQEYINDYDKIPTPYIGKN